MADETVLYAASPSMFRNAPAQFLIYLLLCVIGIGIPLLLIWWLRCIGTKLTVTDKRTTMRTGILSKSTTEVWHSDVRNVQISQSFFQRLLGVGYVGISSSGQSGVEIGVYGIPSPTKVKSIIDRHRS